MALCCSDRLAHDCSIGEFNQQTMRTPTAGRPCIMTWTGRSGGTLSPGRPGLCPCQPEAACARGPWQEGPRPQEQDRRACGTERVLSPAPLSGALRGVPARRGRRRRSNGSGAGEGFPQKSQQTDGDMIRPQLLDPHSAAGAICGKSGLAQIAGPRPGHWRNARCRVYWFLSRPLSASGMPVPSGRPPEEGRTGRSSTR
jgi:hypothetical protein